MNDMYRSSSICDNTVLFLFIVILFQALCYVTFHTIGVRVWIITSYLIVIIDILDEITSRNVSLNIPIFKLISVTIC